MKRILMIVDPQLDFISGSLPVPQAAEAMQQLAAYIDHQSGNYIYAIVTTDWHPADHCSFQENGGIWPTHCRQGTTGAALFEPLEQALEKSALPTAILRKGTDSNREEYSIFQNAVAADRIHHILQETGAEGIDLCGLAGDVCVQNTLKEGIERYGASFFHVLEAFSPSLDGGATLHKTLHTLYRS